VFQKNVKTPRRQEKAIFGRRECEYWRINMNIYDIYETVAGNISNWVGKGVTRDAYTTRAVRLPEAIEHARIIVDHLWNSDAADPQFWADACSSKSHLYDSMATLELWIDQQTARSISEWSTHETFLGLRLDRPHLFAFVAGFLVAVLFFLPEIVGLTC